MAQVTLHLSSKEAEEILFALKLRGSQTKTSSMQKAECEDLRVKLNAAFEQAFNWQHLPDRLSAQKNDIRVTITSRNRW